MDRKPSLRANRPGEDWPLAVTYRGPRGIGGRINNESEPKLFKPRSRTIPNNLKIGIPTGRIKTKKKTRKEGWFFAIRG